MSLKLRRITFFVEDLPAATTYYGDTLGMAPADVRKGWSAYKVSKSFEIAFHRGKGKYPRLQFVTTKDLGSVREKMNQNGAKLGPIKDFSDSVMRCSGKDKDRNTIEIFFDPNHIIWN